MEAPWGSRMPQPTPILEGTLKLASGPRAGRPPHSIPTESPSGCQDHLRFLRVVGTKPDCPNHPWWSPSPSVAQTWETFPPNVGQEKVPGEGDRHPPASHPHLSPGQCSCDEGGTGLWSGHFGPVSHLRRGLMCKLRGMHFYAFSYSEQSFSEQARGWGWVLSKT